MQTKRTGCAYSVEEGSPATGLLKDSHKAVFQNPAQTPILAKTARKQVVMSYSFQHAALRRSAVVGSAVS